MADAVAKSTEGMVKLVLDDVTGDMVSRNELKKRTQKRARKAAGAEARANTASNSVSSAVTASFQLKEAPPIDADAMFKQGFLADVYKARPSTNVVTRFPPEPNGYLHLGHAKAIAVDFGFARYHGGKAILRFDDTNPDQEEQVFIDSTLEIIKWLGFTPDLVTYSSDNFQRLYNLAEDLIKKGGAYVCHCPEAALKLQRGSKEGKEGPRYRCDHAERDVDVNLTEFRNMRDGKYEPQTAFLRMKQDIESGNPQMWDLAAYRIPKKQTTHARAPEWKIFPTYDFTHCLCDSFEGITHSLCTTEFILSRESYEWLNRTLGVYEPMQREFGRLRVSGTIMSKRALKKLVEDKLIRGWDDPRLYTLIAIKRRGIPPGALLAFISELGVTTARTLIPIARFEQTVRQYLELSVPRLMMVLDPIPVTIEGLDDTADADVPFLSKVAKFGSHKVRVTRTVYIDRTDFREVDSKGYFRLAPGKAVGLLHFPHPIKAVSFSKDESSGKVTSIQAIVDKDSKPKSYIQWVPDGSINVEARIHTALFKSDDPMTVEGGFLSDMNKDTETIYPGALIEEGFHEVRQRAPWPATSGEEGSASGPESVRFQAMRVGYFAMDSDSAGERIVLNRIVSLKADSGKG